MSNLLHVRHRAMVPNFVGNGSHLAIADPARNNQFEEFQISRNVKSKSMTGYAPRNVDPNGSDLFLLATGRLCLELSRLAI